MNCWICGDHATTGEHRTKASDLKSEFGVVSQKSPIYLHTGSMKNIPVNSIRKSRVLKSEALICAACNNSRTAPFDKAWQAMSDYLRSKNEFELGGVVKLHKVFPGNTKEQMLNIHLFFLKLFGCAIIEYQIPIDTLIFSESILHRRPHPKVFISFGYSSESCTGSSDVHAAIVGHKAAYAVWFYWVGKISVSIMYAEPDQRRVGLRKAWHPGALKKYLKLAQHE